MNIPFFRKRDKSIENTIYSLLFIPDYKKILLITQKELPTYYYTKLFKE